MCKTRLLDLLLLIGLLVFEWTVNAVEIAYFFLPSPVFLSPFFFIFDVRLCSHLSSQSITLFLEYLPRALLLTTFELELCH